MLDITFEPRKSHKDGRLENKVGRLSIRMPSHLLLLVRKARS